MPAGVLAADPWTVSANTDLVKADFISSSGSGATLYLENHVSMEPFNIPAAGAVLDAIGFAGGYSQEVSWTNGTGPAVSCPKGLTDLFSFCHTDANGGWALIADGLRTELVLSGSDTGSLKLDVGPSQRSLAYDGTIASIGIALEVLNPSPGIIFENSAHIASLALQLLPEAGAMAAALKRGDGITAGFEMLALAKRAAQIIADHITDWAIGRLVAMNPYFTGAGLAIKASQASMALANLATHLQAGYLNTVVAVNYASSGAAVAPPAASGTGFRAPPTPVPTAPLGQTPIVTTKVIHRLGPENSTIDFQQPVVSGIAAAAAGAINATIQAKVDAYIADVDQQPVMPGDDPSSVTGSFKVAFVSSSLLSIEFNVENYGTGEGHGVELAGSLTFAVSSGAQIHLGDLFSDQSAGIAVLQTQAHNLALQLLVQRDGSYFGTLLADPAIWSMADFDKAWVFSPAGLQLSFSQGDIAAMADGLLTITIPWSSLAGVLKQDGPASSFLR
jgi:hypothetical protein